MHHAATHGARILELMDIGNATCAKTQVAPEQISGCGGLRVFIGKRSVIMLKETEMTQYKVGDEVLVRGKIEGVDSVDGTMRIRFQSVGYGALWIFGKFICSLAPEFNPGELIEVRSTEHEGWRKKYFVGWIPSARMPYFINDEWPLHSSNYCSRAELYARKLQPKDEPVTAEEMADLIDEVTCHDLKEAIEKVFEKLKGRRIGGDK